MHNRDVIRSAIGGLWRQKARSTLTLLGVAVGACALAFSLSLGIGLRALIDNEFRSREEFWWVTVFPKNRGQKIVAEKDIPAAELTISADVPEDRRARLRDRLVQQYQDRFRYEEISLLTRQQLAPLAQLPDVQQVRTHRSGHGQIWVGERSISGSLYGGLFDQFDPPLENRLILGRLPSADSPDEAVLSEMALYELGVRTDAELSAILGKPVQVVVGRSEFDKAGSLASMLMMNPGDVQEVITKTQAETLNKIVSQLPGKIDQFDLSAREKQLVKAVMTRPVKPISKPQQQYKAVFKIVGVIRELIPSEKDVEPFRLPHKMRGEGTALLTTLSGAERVVAYTPELVGRGYPEAYVKVQPGGDLQAVVDGIRANGLDCISGIQVYRNVKREVTLIAAGLNLFALISLLVASLGITNTLFTSVLERTKEIGIWKSLGARDGTILRLFLTEGAVIGIVGGLLGLLSAWALSIPADGLVRRLIQDQSNNTLHTQTVFEYPLWLSCGAVAFAAGVTTLAALYPARRASRVQPVEALRHE